MSNRKCCKECPWTVRNNHNDKMIENINKFVNNGTFKDKKHKCHMIDPKIWGDVNSENICVGSLNNN